MLFCLAFRPLIPYEPPLRDHDYLRLQFLGVRDAWLSCQDSTCGWTKCPSGDSAYLWYDNIHCCFSFFQIIGEGTSNAKIKSGQRIRLRWAHEPNTWMGCTSNTKCKKRSCPGTTSEGGNFTKCHSEIFRIYSRSSTIKNGDLVMLYYPNNDKYVSIEGENYEADTSLNFCPGMTPPAYLSYAICSKNVFRIHRKPDHSL